MKITIGNNKKDNIDDNITQEKGVKEKSKILLIACSIVVAMSLWLFVVDPVRTVTVSIPVEISGLTNNSLIKGRDIMVTDSKIPQKINVTIRGRKSQLDKVNQQAFVSVLDFTLVENVEQTSINLDTPVGLKNMRGVRVLGIQPTEVSVDLEKVSDNTLMLEIRTIGNPKKGYEILEKNAVPDIIHLNDNENLAGRADKAVAYVDVNELSGNVQKQVDVVILDKDGKILSEGEYSTDVSITVGKRVPIEPSIVGQLSEDYTYNQSKVVVEPRTVVITGNSQELRVIDRIQTEEIDISKLDQISIVKANLMLPGGVKIADGTSVVDVTIPIRVVFQKNE